MRWPPKADFRKINRSAFKLIGAAAGRATSASGMQDVISFIGFGEAGAALAADWLPEIARARAFDVKTDDPAARSPKLQDYARAAVDGCGTLAEALDDASAAISVVTADQALAAATAAAALLSPGLFWLDMNSVAPHTKRTAAARVDAAGGRYVDVAVMSPVQPLRRNVPLLVSGPHAGDAVALLNRLGFTNVRSVGGEVGAASSVKMVRSVMVKGLEALTAECLLAAEAAGVRDEVIASLDASWPGADWQRRADYNLDRMIVHGRRRAAEMDEVVHTLDTLGIDAALSRATAARQRAIGSVAVCPPEGLGAKLALLLPASRKTAA